MVSQQINRGISLGEILICQAGRLHPSRHLRASHILRGPDHPDPSYDKFMTESVAKGFYPQVLEKVQEVIEVKTYEDYPDRSKEYRASIYILTPDELRELLEEVRRITLEDHYRDIEQFHQMRITA